MFNRIGQFAYARRYIVIAVWIMLFLVSAPFISRVPSVLKVGGFSNDTVESAQARQLLEANIASFSPSTLVVIFQSEQLLATDPAFVTQSEVALADIKNHPDVIGATRFIDNPAQISADRHTAYTVINLDVTSEEAQRILPDIRDRLNETELTTTLAGAPTFFDDIETLSENDLRRAELIAVPIALVALVFVFGSVVGAAVPLLVGGLSVATVLGLLFVVAQFVDMSIFVLNLTTMLGLGLAIDYSLFMTSRFREELDDHDVPTATAITVSTAGRAVFFSGITVLIGLSGLTIFDFMFLRSIGVAGIFVVGISLVGALTLLPAVLGVVGNRVNALSVLRRRPNDTSPFWSRLSHFVMDRPWQVFIPTLIILLVLGAPFINANLSSPNSSILPRRVESRRGFEILRNNFGEGEIAPILVAVQTSGSITSRANLEALYAFTRDIAADERVTKIDSIVSLDPRVSLEQYELLYQNPDQIADPFFRESFNRLASDNVTAVLIYPRGASGSSATKDLVNKIRSYHPDGTLTFRVDGGTAEIMDVIDRMYSQFPGIAAIIILMTYLVLMYQFRSLILPLKAILMNALSITASFGAVVFIFQEGHFASLLRFDKLGYVEASQPIVMFCILFGLSMDYEVFLLSRIRESYLETGDNRASVASGLQSSGRIITGAALIVVVVTASFVSAEIVLVKSLGLGIAIAILIDATIVRALLVPATMRLLGDINWWLPSWIRRALPDREYAH